MHIQILVCSLLFLNMYFFHEGANVWLKAVLKTFCDMPFVCCMLFAVCELCVFMLKLLHRKKCLSNMSIN